MMAFSSAPISAARLDGGKSHEIFRSPGTTCRSIRRLRDSQSGVVDLLVAEIFNLVVRPCGHDADPGLLRLFRALRAGVALPAAALVPMASAADRGE